MFQCQSLEEAIPRCRAPDLSIVLYPLPGQRLVPSQAGEGAVHWPEPVQRSEAQPLT